MLKLLGLDGLIGKLVLAGAGIAALGTIAYTLYLWREADIARWQELGRLECQTAVEKAYNRGLAENLEAVRKAVEEADEARRRIELVRAQLETRNKELLEELDAQEFEMARLANRTCTPDGKITIPADIIDLLNKGVGP